MVVEDAAEERLEVRLRPGLRRGLRVAYTRRVWLILKIAHFAWISTPR